MIRVVHRVLSTSAIGKGSLYLSGACSRPAKFGTHAVPHRGSNDIFLAKLVEKAPATKKE